MMRTLWTLLAALSCIYSSGQCTANFTIPSGTTFCSNQIINLTNSSGVVDSSRWSWSGPTTGVQSGTGSPNFSSALTGSGTFLICLKIFRGNCVDSLYQSLSVNPAPAAPTFTVPVNICSGTAASFIPSPTIPGTTYNWNFGSGTVPGPSASHIFTSIGGGTQSFPVILTATANGCSSSASQNIIIKQQPDASLVDINNGSQQFTNCGGGPLSVELVSTSSTQSTNTNYSINWGDGTSVYTSSTLADVPPGVVHNYSGTGYFNITETVTANSCSTSITYRAFNGTNPSGSLGNPGGTTGLCSPASLNFPITGVAGNTPGTQYIITVNDGSPADTFSQPPPANYSHVFSLSSCGYSTPSYSNSFFVRMQAVNQCNSSTIIVDPITINSKPQANFTISPDTIVCVNSNVIFRNTSIGGALVNNSNVCDSTNIVNWVISPSVGHTVVSGSEGSNPPFINLPGTWGSNVLTENFNTPGVYSIRLKIRSKAVNCGTDSITKTICVVSPPTPQFTVSPTIGCAPFIVTPTNTSVIPPGCSAPSLSWTVTKTSTTCPGDSAVDYRFVSNTNAQSFTPSIQFNNSGTYTLNLSITNKCGTLSAGAQTITVKTKPTAGISAVSPVCVNQPLTPTTNTQPCGGTISGYSWSFPNGSPSSSISSSPSVSYSSTGTNNIFLSVTNECGTTVATSSINVLGSPGANAGPDQSICSGGTTIIGAGNVSGIVYSWSPATGLSSTTVSNPTVALSNNTAFPVVYTYILTTVNAANCISRDTVLVTVNPRPVVNISPVAPAICPGSSVTLTASGAVSYSWSPTTGLNPTSGATVNASPPSTAVYSVTATDANTCTSTASVTVTIYPLPAVSAGRDTTLCNQPIPVQLTGTPSNGTWSGPGISSSGVFTPTGVGSSMVIYSYTDANTCSNRDTAIVSVIAPNPANAGRDTAICQSTPTLQLFGSPAGGLWSGSSQVTSSGVFSTSIAGVFALRYTYGTGSCANSDTVIVTVYAKPTVVVSPPNTSLCIGNSIRLTASGANVYTWSPASGLSSTSGDTVNAHPIGTTTYTVTGVNINGCTASATTNVTVNTLPTVSAGRDTLLCNQPIAVQLVGAPVGGTWSGPGITPSGNFTPSGTGSFTEYYSYTDANSCWNNDSMIITVVAPSPANAGRDTAICQFSPPLQLSGSPSGGTWSGSSSISQSGLLTTNTAGSYNLIYVYGTGTCTNRDTVTVIINPQPVISIIPGSTTICTGTSIRLTAHGGSVYSWSPATGLNGTSGDTVNAHPLISTAYSVTGTDNRGCSASTTAAVNVNQLPVVSAGPDTQVCNQVFATQLAGTPPGGVWNGPGITTTGSFTPSSTGIFTEYYSYTDANGCSNIDSMTITVVSPSPANAGRDTAICQFSPALQLSGAPAGGVWSGSSAVTQSGIFTSNTAGVFTLVYTSGTGSCVTSDTVVLTVHPAPALIISPASASICAGDSTTLQVSGANSYLWAPGTGLSSTTSSTVTAHPTGTTTYNVQGTISFTGCKSSDSVTVQVRPRPLVTNTPLIQKICSGSTSSAVVLTSSLSNTTFSWTASPTGGVTGYSASGTSVIPPQNLVNSDTSFHYVFYSITPSANGCIGPVATDTILVNPTPGITLPSAQTICSGDISVPVHIVSVISNTIIHWTGSGATGISGYNTSGIGDIPAQQLYNASQSPAAATYTITDTLNGCGGPSSNYNITVNPSPTVQYSQPDQIICSGSSTTAVALSAIPAGSNITWTATVPSGITGATSGGTTSIPAMVLTNSSNQPLTITYQAQAATTNVICPGAISTYRITVNPTPTLTISNVNDTICSSTIISSQFTSAVTGTLFSWTTNFPAQITGAAAGSADSIHQVLVNSDSIVHSGYYAIATSAAGCPGATGTVNVTVNPSPVISFSLPDQTLCSGGTTQQVTIHSSTPGATISWTTSAPATISGVSAAGNTTIPAQVITNSGNIIETINYLVSTSFGGCAGSANQYHVTVNPTPHILNTDTLQTICSGDQLAAIPLTSDVSGASFAWSATSPVSVTGYIPNGNTATIPAQIIGNSSNIADTVIYTVTPTANSCPGPSKMLKIVILPLPQLSILPDSQQLCNANRSTPITITSSVSGTLCTWTGTANNVSGSLGGDTTSVIPDMLLFNISPVADTGYVRYTIAPRAAGCPGNIATAMIEVDPDPISNFALAQATLCSSTPAVVATNGLVYGHPDSLTIAWGDGTTSIINPNPGQPVWSNASHLYANPAFTPDTFTIRLTAHNHCGDSSISKRVVVLPNTINAFFNSSVSQGCAPLSVTFTDFSSGGTTASWCFDYDSINRVCLGPGQVVAPHSTISHTFGQGNHVVALFVNDGCSFDTVFHVIKVNDSTAANFVFTDNVCEGAQVRFRDSSYLASGSFVTGYQWTFGDMDSSNLSSPIHVYHSAGTVSACLQVTSSSGCTSSICKPVHINQRPVAAFSDTNVCVNSQPALLQNSSQGASFYLWDFGDGNTSTIANPLHVYMDSGSYTISLVAMTGQCADTTNASITIYPKAQAQFILPAVYRCGLPSVIQPINQSSGASGYLWNFGNGLTSTNINPSAQYTFAGNFTIRLVASNIYNCSDTTAKNIDIYPYPNIGSVSVDPAEGCQPLAVKITTNATDAQSYEWGFGDGNVVTANSANEIYHTFQTPGQYSITAYAYSNAACGDTVVLVDTVTVYQRPLADFTYTQDSAIYPLDGTISFHNLSQNAVQYAWDFSDGSTSSETDPSHRFETVASFNVLLVAISDHGCRDTLGKTIDVLKKALYVPNALSPDFGGYDSLVRIWKPVGIGLRTYHAAVYDKWGKLLWESTLLNNTQPLEWWDGTYQGQPCPQDVYVWKVDAVFLDGQIWEGMTYKPDEGGGIKRIGSITLIR